MTFCYNSLPLQLLFPLLMCALCYRLNPYQSVHYTIGIKYIQYSYSYNNLCHFSTVRISFKASQDCKFQICIMHYNESVIYTLLLWCTCQLLVMITVTRITQCQSNICTWLSSQEIDLNQSDMIATWFYLSCLPIPSTTQYIFYCCSQAEHHSLHTWRTLFHTFS